MSPKKIGYWSVVSIGIGGMVGGGIFAVLGLSVEMTRGAAPAAFTIAGLVALVTAYAYVRLSVTFPSQGGTVTFLDKAFGSGLLTGTANILLWISYIVMLSLYAFAFGSYAAAMFPAGSRLIWKHVLISGAVIGVTGLNFLSVELIGGAEQWIVAIKIAILLFFVAVGAWTIDAARLTVGSWPNAAPILAGAMIIFLAYEGFELIANTAGDVRDPDHCVQIFHDTIVSHAGHSHNNAGPRRYAMAGIAGDHARRTGALPLAAGTLPAHHGPLHRARSAPGSPRTGPTRTPDRATGPCQFQIVKAR